MSRPAGSLSYLAFADDCITYRYIGHSAFVTILPAHLLFLKLSTGRSIRTHYLRLISENLRWQTDEPKLFSRAVLGTPGSTADSLPSHTPGRPDGRIRAFWKDLIGFDLGRYALIIAILTVGITIPALSWYAAVPMTSMADITALYNCFAVAALVFSVWFLGDRWQAVSHSIASDAPSVPVDPTLMLENTIYSTRSSLSCWRSAASWSSRMEVQNTRSRRARSTRSRERRTAQTRPRALPSSHIHSSATCSRCWAQ